MVGARFDLQGTHFWISPVFRFAIFKLPFPLIRTHGHHSSMGDYGSQPTPHHSILYFKELNEVDNFVTYISDKI